MQILKNLLAGWMYLAINFSIIFFLTPFIIATLGPAEYGGWALILSIISFFNLADFGMTSAMLRFYSKALGGKDAQEPVRIFSNIQFVFIIIAFAVLLLAQGTALLAPLFFTKIPADLIPEFQLSIAIMGLASALLFAVKPIGGIIAAHERYDLIHAVEIMGAILQGFLVFLFIRAGYGLPGMASAVLLTALAKGALEFSFAYRLSGGLQINIGSIGRQTLSVIFSYSMITLLLMLCEYAQMQVDVLMVGKFFSLNAVAHYAIATQFILYYVLAHRTLTSTYMPRMSKLLGQEDWPAIRAETVQGSRISAGLAIFLAISLIGFAQYFINLWLGPKFELSYKILVILVAGMSVMLLINPVTQIYRVLNQHALLLKLRVIETIINVIISLILLYVIGIYGPAVGTLIGALVIRTYFEPKLACQMIKMPYVDYVKRSLARPLIYGGFYALLVFPVRLILAPADVGLFTFVLLVMVYGTIGLLLAYGLILIPEERETIKNKLAHSVPVLSRLARPAAAGNHID